MSFVRPLARGSTVEHLTLDQGVPGSNPGAPANSAAGVKGNLVPDAYLAAPAIETGAEFVTADRDDARLPGLRWRHPLADA
jgi:hypothetical protein